MRELAAAATVLGLSPLDVTVVEDYRLQVWGRGRSRAPVRCNIARRAVFVAHDRCAIRSPRCRSRVATHAQDGMRSIWDEAAVHHHVAAAVERTGAGTVRWYRSRGCSTNAELREHSW